MIWQFAYTVSKVFNVSNYHNGLRRIVGVQKTICDRLISIVAMQLYLEAILTKMEQTASDQVSFKIY